MAVVLKKIEEYQKKIKEFAVEAEEMRLKKVNEELEEAKKQDDYLRIQRILASQKNLDSNPQASTGGIMGFIRGILDLLKKSKDTAKVDEHRPQDTLKQSLHQLTQQVEIDTDFTRVDNFIDEIASAISPKFTHMKFKTSNNHAFPHGDFNNGNPALSRIVPDPDAARADIDNMKKINNLSLPGVISAIFESRDNQITVLTENEKAELAVRAVTKAYTAKKFLRIEDVSKDKLLKVAENAKRQVILYLRTRKHLDELYNGTARFDADGNRIEDATAAKARFEEARAILSRSALGAEFLNNMSYGNKMKFSNLNTNLADKLLKINSYYDKLTSADANDQLDAEGKAKLRNDLMFCLNNLSETNSEVDALYKEVRLEKNIQRADKSDLKDIVRNNAPTLANGAANIRNVLQIQQDHNLILLKLDAPKKELLKKLEKEHADLLSWRKHILALVDMRDNQHLALTAEQALSVSNLPILEGEVTDKNVERQNLIHTFAKELQREEKKRSTKTFYGD